MNTTGVELSTSLTDDVWNSALFKTMFYIIILEIRSFQNQCISGERNGSCAYLAIWTETPLGGLASCSSFSLVMQMLWTCSATCTPTVKCLLPSVFKKKRTLENKCNGLPWSGPAFYTCTAKPWPKHSKQTDELPGVEMPSFMDGWQVVG